MFVVCVLFGVMKVVIGIGEWRMVLMICCIDVLRLLGVLSCRIVSGVCLWVVWLSECMMKLVLVGLIVLLMGIMMIGCVVGVLVDGGVVSVVYMMSSVVNSVVCVICVDSG